MGGIDLQAIETEVRGLLAGRPGGIGEVDRALLSVLMDNFGLIEQFDISIRENGAMVHLANKCLAPHPAIKARDATVRRVVMLARELGIELRRPTVRTEPESPYASLLAGYKRV